MKWSAGAAAVLIGLAGLPASPTAQETQTYIYDVHGRLVSVDRSAGLDTTYAYDAANNRTLRVVGASDAPSPFELGPPVTNAVGGTYHSSAAPTLAGFSAPVSVTVSGGQYRIGAGGWTTAAGSVTAGQSVQVRVLAPAAGGASQTATLTAGGVSDTFQVTTGIDSTPDDFDLGGVAAAAAGAWAVSNLATITGINVAAPVAITNGQYSIDGGGWTTANGTIAAGQSVRVRGVAPSTFGALIVTLTVGGVSEAVSVTRESSPEPCVPPPGQDICIEV